MPRFTRALFFSDLHLGWIPVLASHERLLAHLAAAVDDAELVVLNGDIVDTYRVTSSPRARDVIARFVALVISWRAEGREVVYIEGNHDTVEEATEAARRPPLASSLGNPPLLPDRWCFDFLGTHDERICALHGHRFTDAPMRFGAYERIGRRWLRLENQIYAASATARAAYPYGSGWVVGAIGLTEDVTWRPGFIARTRRWDFDHVVHGHYHFGPGEIRLPRLTLHRSGAWVSHGHLGTVDRVLRYRDGRFERLALEGERWVVTGDGR